VYTVADLPVLFSLLRLLFWLLLLRLSYLWSFCSFFVLV